MLDEPALTTRIVSLAVQIAGKAAVPLRAAA
jgi:hypothetical protein